MEEEASADTVCISPNTLIATILFFFVTLSVIIILIFVNIKEFILYRTKKMNEKWVVVDEANNNPGRISMDEHKHPGQVLDLSDNNTDELHPDEDYSHKQNKYSMGGKMINMEDTQEDIESLDGAGRESDIYHSSSKKDKGYVEMGTLGRESIKVATRESMPQHYQQQQHEEVEGESDYADESAEYEGEDEAEAEEEEEEEEQEKDDDQQPQEDNSMPKKQLKV